MTKTAPKLRAVESDPTIASTIKDLLGGTYTKDMQMAFPDIDPGVRVCGYSVLCQLRSANRISRGGIIFTDNEKDAEKYRMQAGLVRAMGPSAFKRRDNLEPWPEGNWCMPGDFVRLPMYGGDRFLVPHQVKDQITSSTINDDVMFVFYKDTDIVATILGDPLKLKTS
jgi:co-chaperonin GroES (HSP10)